MCVGGESGSRRNTGGKENTGNTGEEEVENDKTQEDVTTRCGSKQLTNHQNHDVALALVILLLVMQEYCNL